MTTFVLIAMIRPQFRMVLDGQRPVLSRHSNGGRTEEIFKIRYLVFKDRLNSDREIEFVTAISGAPSLSQILLFISSAEALLVISAWTEEGCDPLR